MEKGLIEVGLEAGKISAQNERLKIALTKAMVQFKFYVNQHIAKNPPDSAKASTNMHFADMCEAALTDTGREGEGT